MTRAEDVPGCWVAHCLDFDIMSIGDSPQHALEMVREAVGLALADDLNHGRDPHERRADDKHTRVPVNQMDTKGADFKEFAAPLTVVLATQREDGLAPKTNLNVDAYDVLTAA